jgi:hypothetical protein
MLEMRELEGSLHPRTYSGGSSATQDNAAAATPKTIGHQRRAEGSQIPTGPAVQVRRARTHLQASKYSVFRKFFTRIAHEDAMT